MQLYSLNKSFDEQKGRVQGATKEGGEFLAARALSRKPIASGRRLRSRAEKRQRRQEIERVMDAISSHLTRVCCFVPQAVTDFYANSCYGKALDCPVVETFDAGAWAFFCCFCCFCRFLSCLLDTFLPRTSACHCFLLASPPHFPWYPVCLH